MNWRGFFVAVLLVSMSVLVVGGWALAAPPAQTAPATLAKGGQLYDNWWEAARVAEPKGDQPLWATQSTNTRKGLDTWRCKECHGWDYKGKDGAYGSGSHKTGFVGVVDASKTKTQDQIAAILKGSSNPNHNFGTVLDDANINALAAFVKEGVNPDLTQVVDYATKKPKGADAAHGKTLYTDTCTACHGADGAKLNFGTTAAPEFVGTIAVDNPQEFLHKVRFGQPGTGMPTGIQNGWAVKDGVDVLAFAQTLSTGKPAAAPVLAPTSAPAATVLPKTGEPAAWLAMAAPTGFFLLIAGMAARKRSRHRG